MGFQLNSVVPWGRTMQEYQNMFLLTEDDMQKKIAGFGDGPASFNYQAKKKGCSVTSFDPIYQFSGTQLETRIEEVREIVIRQMQENVQNYVWTNIKNVQELELLRMGAMRLFLNDYEQGRHEGRYVYHELPEPLPCEDGAFDIGLSSHFLLMYTALGYDFHIAAIREMLRVCREVRIFSLCDLDGRPSVLTDRVTDFFSRDYQTEILETNYEFQKNARHLLKISRKKGYR